MSYHSFENDLLAKFEYDLKNGAISMKYQPQVQNGKITAEALLRFRYGLSVYPQLVVGIVINNGLFAELSKAIVNKVAMQLKKRPLLLQEAFLLPKLFCIRTRLQRWRTRKKFSRRSLCARVITA